jgi:hypothetical protein
MSAARKRSAASPRGAQGARARAKPPQARVGHQRNGPQLMGRATSRRGPPWSPSASTNSFSRRLSSWLKTERAPINSPLRYILRHTRTIAASVDVLLPGMSRGERRKAALSVARVGTVIIRRAFHSCLPRRRKFNAASLQRPMCSRNFELIRDHRLDGGVRGGTLLCGRFVSRTAENGPTRGPEREPLALAASLSSATLCPAGQPALGVSLAFVNDEIVPRRWFKFQRNE